MKENRQNHGRHFNKLEHQHPGVAHRSSAYLDK